ncbi:PIR Superfamily Protein [Plasmodium ovale wallikeri]|uniref:PIR Superfamily Protein n=1 Tax=Plasmodium ovale wallikeri TaxID=864142 RepID=A0A1A9AGC7_PLAOA|nr:PIR Superfamily Protein [Plasmodium ovale wallikeri]
MVHVTFLKTDNREQERIDRCYSVLSDIQNTIDEIAELSKAERDKPVLLQKCKKLSEHLSNYYKIKEECYDSEFSYHRNYISELIHNDLMKCSNYERLKILALGTKEEIAKRFKINEQGKVEDEEVEITQPVKEGLETTVCTKEPCNTEKLQNQAQDGIIQDHQGKDGEEGVQLTPESSQTAEPLNMLAQANPKLSQGEIGDLSAPSGKEPSADLAQVSRHDGKGELPSNPSDLLQGRTHANSGPNGDSDSKSLGNSNNLQVGLPAPSMPETQYVAPSNFPNAAVTADPGHENGHINHTSQIREGGTVSVPTSTEATFTVQSSPAVPTLSHGAQPDSQVNSVYSSASSNERDGQSHSSQSTSHSAGHLPLVAALNVGEDDTDLSTPKDEQETISIKTYVIIIVASFAAVMLSAFLVKFTPVRKYFSKNRKTKRQTIQEELDRIMYSPSNFEEDRIYLSYSYPESSFYDVQYEN